MGLASLCEGSAQPALPVGVTPSVGTLLNIGSTSGPRTRSRACSQPSAIGRKNQRLPEPEDRPRQGLRADDVSPAEMAETGRRNPSSGDRTFRDGIKQLQTAAQSCRHHLSGIAQIDAHTGALELIAAFQPDPTKIKKRSFFVFGVAVWRLVALGTTPL